MRATASHRRGIEFIAGSKQMVETPHAGKAAGMFTIAAGYGYIPSDEDAQSWGADLIVDDTRELTTILLQGVNLDSS